VVQVYDVVTEGGRPWIVMELLDARSLADMVIEDGPVAPRAVAKIGIALLGALEVAHAAGVLHRDVKPANVLIKVRGGVETAFLTDFGLTKERAVAADLTGTGLAIGTADYIAPEQAQGADLDGRADVYALGCVLFQAVSGVVPFARPNDLEKMWAHVHDPPPDLLEIRPELPRALGDVVARAMAKEPDDRQATASELAREAAAALVD
jgi:eukaryotic-like serine/threonine-protein kinase